MKICAIICEFNPFHNGHKHIIERARELSDCDAVLCIMSGSFTQRGEMCICDKYVRAKHALLGGADCVIELPAAFAVAPADVFARGAVKILSSVPNVDALAFGCENPEGDYPRAAEILLNETPLFKQTLASSLESGESYIKSYAAAFSACGGDPSLISNPNNILGVEYAKAILRSGAKIRLLPVKREGSGYNDGSLAENFSSASAIRKNLKSEKIADNVPDFVLGDILNAGGEVEAYENMARNCLFLTDGATLKKIYGCSEGLESKLKNLENLPYGEIIKRCSSKRYTSSRVSRILCANALKLYGGDSERFLKSDLYIKPLAVRKSTADGLFSELAKSLYPVVTDGFGAQLDGAAKECFGKDVYAYSLYNFLTGAERERRGYDYTLFI